MLRALAPGDRVVLLDERGGDVTSHGAKSTPSGASELRAGVGGSG